MSERILSIACRSWTGLAGPTVPGARGVVGGEVHPLPACPLRRPCRRPAAMAAACHPCKRRSRSKHSLHSHAHVVHPWTLPVATAWTCCSALALTGPELRSSLRTRRPPATEPGLPGSSGQRRRLVGKGCCHGWLPRCTLPLHACACPTDLDACVDYTPAHSFRLPHPKQQSVAIVFLDARRAFEHAHIILHSVSPLTVHSHETTADKFVVVSQNHVADRAPSRHCRPGRCDTRDACRQAGKAAGRDRSCAGVAEKRQGRKQGIPI